MDLSALFVPANTSRSGIANTRTSAEERSCVLLCAHAKAVCVKQLLRLEYIKDEIISKSKIHKHGTVSIVIIFFWDKTHRVQLIESA